jgi:hypothetical protein
MKITMPMKHDGGKDQNEPIKEYTTGPFVGMLLETFVFGNDALAILGNAVVQIVDHRVAALDHSGLLQRSLLQHSSHASQLSFVHCLQFLLLFQLRSI